MVICIEQWHARIGLFVARSTKEKFTVYNDLNIVNYKIFALIMLLLAHDDTESNPGPNGGTSNYFSCCHWNVNSILAHNKHSLLSAYNTLHKFDVIYISEIYLDKSADNDALSTDGYNIIWADHPNNHNRGGACIYFKEQLKLKQIIPPISLSVFFVRYQWVAPPVKQLVNLLIFWKILKNFCTKFSSSDHPL